MGATSPGAIAQYDPVHRDFHSWMLTGTDPEDLDIGEEGSGTLPYVRGTGGLLALIETMFASVNGTPFDDVEVYDPFVEGEPLYNLLSRLGEINDDMFGVSGNFHPSEEWQERYDEVKMKLDGMQAEIDALVAAFQAKTELMAAGQKAELNRAFADAGGIGSSNRTLAYTLLVRDIARQVGEYRAQLEHQYESQKMQLLGDLPFRLTALDVDFRDRRTAYMQVYLAATEMLYNAKKMMVQEELQFAIESTLWDVNLYGFAGQSLSAINGASIVPRSPNPKLEAISVGAQAVGAGINLVRGAFDLHRALN